MKADDEGEVLQTVARRIERLIRQCPSVNSPDKDMEEALYCAVRRTKRALHVAGSSPKSPVNYKQFLGELSNVEQNYYLMYGSKSKTLKKTSNALVTTHIIRRQHHPHHRPHKQSSAFKAKLDMEKIRVPPRHKELLYKEDCKCYDFGSTDHILLKITKARDENRVVRC